MLSVGRKYETTHNWIKFGLDMRKASYRLWLLLGAAASKCIYLAGIPLRPAKQEEVAVMSLRRGIRATTAIEGNTLSEADVEKIRLGQEDEMPRSRAYQAQEIKNMLDAYNGVALEINRGRACEVSSRQLNADNAVILSKLKLQEGVIPGEIRTYAVGAGDYLGAPAEDCEYLVDRLMEWLSSDCWLGAEYRMAEGILKGIVGHVYMTWIHPYGNGNGRGARLLEFRILQNAGVPFIAAHLLTTHYNDTRDKYYEMLRQSSRVRNGELKFIEYALQGFVDGLDKEIREILDEQVRVTWQNYVNEYSFSGKQTAAMSRRRELLLEISKYELPISPSELKYRLPDKILKQYHGSEKKLARDINYLHGEGLIYAIEGGYTAAKDKVKAFMPLRVLLSADEVSGEGNDSIHS